MDVFALASFGQLLKECRKRRHLTQQAVARKLGVHRHTIGSWEQGDYLPESKGIVLELARHLQLDDQKTRQLLEASLTALSPYWLVPLPRNPYFTGREEVLEALHVELGADRAVALSQSVAVQGLGGVGKTQVALEYAYRHALEYSAIFWIGAETDESIVSGLLRIAEALQLPERGDKDQQRMVAAVHHWLTTHSQWLLIWDNVEDLALLARFLPVARQGAILLTTRSSALGTLAQGLDLSPLADEEGLLFLLRRAKVLKSAATREQVCQLAVQLPSQYAAAAELVTAMGGLPLALDQAGAYIEETQCGLPAYLELFRTRRAALLQQRGERSHDHPVSVSATFTLAITATARRHPAAGDLLRVCALLQPDAIPEELFRQGAAHLGAVLEVTCHDPLEWNRVLAIACSYSLLSRQAEEQTLSMHRLVQAILLDTLPEAEREQWSKLVVGALDAVFPEVAATREDAMLKQGERLLSHALLCLHRGGAASESPTFASLAYKSAQYLHVHGQYAEAEPLYQRALRIREQALGPDHPQVAASLNNLATLYGQQGKYAEAEPLLQRALSNWERVLGPDHPDVAYALSNLAELYQEQGKDAEAEPLLQRTLDIREHALGPDHPDVAYVLSKLAVIYRVQGEYAKGEALLQRALHIQEQSLGQEHPAVAVSLNNLASLCQEQGKYAEAEALFQRALSIREQHLGQRHPETAQTLHDLAVFHQKQGNLSEAFSFAERALTTCSRSLGEAHPKTIAVQALYVQLVQERRGMVKEENRCSIHAMSVAVRGATGQVAYTRTVSMREVTFTCTVCGQTVTQPHYPSGRIKYCSEACRAVRAAQMQERRVTMQREKRRSEREARQRDVL